MKNIFKILLGIVLIVSVSSILSAWTIDKTGEDWKAPSSADKIQNPLKAKETAAVKGGKIYKEMCAICHGAKGKGDGFAGMNLNPRPADFTKDLLQNQTDGAIYWKLTKGRPPMAGYEHILKEEQRWQLVNFIRTLKK